MRLISDAGSVSIHHQSAQEKSFLIASPKLPIDAFIELSALRHNREMKSSSSLNNSNTGDREYAH